MQLPTDQRLIQAGELQLRRRLSGELAIRVTERVDVVADFGYRAVESPLGVPQLGGQQRPPHRADHEYFTRRSLTFGVKEYLWDRGRSVGHLAWIPAAVERPSPALSAGWAWYRFEQDGDFVDFETLGRLSRPLPVVGPAPTVQRLCWRRLVACAKLPADGAKAGTHWARSPMEQDFQGFDRSTCRVSRPLREFRFDSDRTDRKGRRSCVPSRINLLLGLGLALAALVGDVPARSRAQSTDPRWLPWLGCWQAEGAPRTPASVRPAADGKSSVEILRVTGSDVVSREVVWADGQQHETSREGCDGWEKGRFSQDGHRVFLSSSHTCEDVVWRHGGASWPSSRPTSGSMSATWAWATTGPRGSSATGAATDQQAEAAGMGGSARTGRGRVRTARMAAADAPTVDDVIEAVRRRARRGGRGMGRRAEGPIQAGRRAAGAHWPTPACRTDVIDVAVAVSYPSHFTVRADGPQARRAGGAVPSAYRWASSSTIRSTIGSATAPTSTATARYGYGKGTAGYPGGYGYGGYGYTPVIVIEQHRPEPRSPRTAGSSPAGATPGRLIGSHRIDRGRCTALPRLGRPRQPPPAPRAAARARRTGRHRPRRGGGGGGRLRSQLHSHRQQTGGARRG